jgi:hypothetical protein
MKLIITEDQLRLIIENEGDGKLFSIPEDLLKLDNGIGIVLNLYNKTKENKGWVGIEISGDLNFYEMDADSVEDIINFVKEVVYIDGMLVIPNGEDFGYNFSKLKVINGSLKAANLDSVSFPNLEYINGDVDLQNTEIINLPKLRKVDGYLRLNGSGISSLPELEYVVTNFSLRQTEIEDLPKLKYVGNILNIMGTPLSNKIFDMSKEDRVKFMKKINVRGDILI